MMGGCLCIFVYIKMMTSGSGRQRQEPFVYSSFIEN